MREMAGLGLAKKHAFGSGKAQRGFWGAQRQARRGTMREMAGPELAKNMRLAVGKGVR